MTVECYDALAETYAERAEATRVSIRATLNKYLLPRMKPHSRFLDVGCSVGVATEEVANHGHIAVGIDISPAMIAVAERDREAGSFYVADYLELVGVSGWDAILCFAFVHLFPKAEAPQIIDKLLYDLEPGGFLYTGTTVEQESSEGWAPKSDYPDAPPRWRARYTAEEFEELVMCVGFEPVLCNQHRDQFGKLWRDVLVRRPA